MSEIIHFIIILLLFILKYFKKKLVYLIILAHFLSQKPTEIVAIRLWKHAFTFFQPIREWLSRNMMSLNRSTQCISIHVVGISSLPSQKIIPLHVYFFFKLVNFENLFSSKVVTISLEYQIFKFWLLRYFFRIMITHIYILFA